MTNPFGNMGGIQIFQDAENMGNPGLRKMKRDDIPLKQQPANKRAALGLITNTLRVQPSRAAKQEGKITKPASGVPFSIYIDDDSTGLENVESHTIKAENIHSDITELKPAHLPLQEQILSHDIDKQVSSPPLPDESPMILDTSIDPQRMQHEETPSERLDNLLMCSDYAEEIYRYMREQELKHRPKPGYMRKQPDVTNSMRCILVDWLVEVAEEYKLHRETLFLAVNYIDRFLSQMSVLRNKLQLVGTACMFLAAKFEEIYPPELSEFVYVTDDTYSQKQILRMEHLVLKVLSFDVAIPTANLFLEKYLKDARADEKTKSLAMYLLESTLIDAEPYLNHLPSVLAASAMCLANITLNQPFWTPESQRKTGFSYSDLTACSKDLLQMFQTAHSHPQQAVREKYRQSKYHQVSSLTPPPSLPFH